MRNMKLKSQKLIKHTIVNKDTQDIDLSNKYFKKEKYSSADNNQMIKDVNKILRSPDFNTYLTKLDEKDPGNKLSEINFYNSNPPNTINNLKKSIDSSSQNLANNYLDFLSNKEIGSPKQRDSNLQKFNSENKININFKINSEIINNNINFDKRTSFREKSNNIRKSIFSLAENNHPNVLRLKETIKEKENIIEKLQIELENAKVTIDKLKNNKENYYKGITNSKQDELLPHAFSDRKKIKINLASECYNTKEKNQIDVLTPSLNNARNLNTLKRYKTVVKDSRLVVKDNNISHKKKNSSSSLFRNKFDDKITDSYNLNSRLNYASSFNGKFSQRSETILDNTPKSINSRKYESETQQIENMNQSLKFPEDFWSIKAKTQKILSGYYDIALKRTRTSGEN